MDWVNYALIYEVPQSNSSVYGGLMELLLLKVTHWGFPAAVLHHHGDPQLQYCTTISSAQQSCQSMEIPRGNIMSF